MTASCSKSISPDSITGMIFAMEGIKNTMVLLNGPMGCKFYHSTTSGHLMKRPDLKLSAGRAAEKGHVEYDVLNNYFFRQPRVPSTYLDGYDYVYGTSEKVEAALNYFRDNFSFDLMVVAASPGASLIGDELTELARRALPDIPTVVLESPGYSEYFSDGYDRALDQLIRQLRPHFGPKKPGRGKPRVNLLGLSVWQRYWEGDKEELTRLLELLGAEVNACPCAGSSLEEVLSLPDADLNLLIYPEMGRETAARLEEYFGTPCYVFPGPPVGFAATEKALREIGELLGLDPAAALEDSERARAECWFALNKLDEMSYLSTLRSFAVEGMDSTVYSYVSFLTDYLGMTPECVSLTGSPDAGMREALGKVLRKCRAEGALTKDILDSRAELVYADANTISALCTRHDAFSGIEISLPGMGYTDIVKKTHLGVRGALFLTEQTVNGLMSKI
ncbi:MAG: nitrogenase component 1 [Oscillospiraceae bacterium]|nr:nitrogenase component 1 [Oscillospiraceae bacterium]